MSASSRPQPRFPSDIAPVSPARPEPAPWRFVYRSQVAIQNRLSEIEALLKRARKAHRLARPGADVHLYVALYRLEDLRALFLWLSSPLYPWPKRLSMHELRKIVRAAEQVAAQPTTLNRQPSTDQRP